MRIRALFVGSSLFRLLFVLLGLAVPFGAQVEEPVDLVDVFIGTSNSRWMLGPYACVPFGMVQPGPDNQTGGWMSGYEYSIANVSGFTHLHAWTMGGLLIMPAAQDLALTDGAVDRPYRGANAGYHSRIRKETEKGSPGYYAVELYDARTKAEITATTRCGFFRFTALEEGEFRVLLDLAFPSEYHFSLADSTITRVSDQQIEGVARSEAWDFEYDLHFVVRFDRPFTSFHGWNADGIVADGASVSGGQDAGAWATFAGGAGDVLQMQTAISLVDLDGARRNLAAELDPFAWDFDGVRAAARARWNDVLGRIRVEGGTREDQIKFYTNLYRSYCAKQTWNDFDGRYRDPYEVVRKLPAGRAIYGGDAFWNTYWNLNPLWALITPEILDNWVGTQLELYEHTGWTSNGPTGVELTGIMQTSHEIALVVGAYQKGIRGYDVEKLFQAVRHTVTEQGGKLGDGVGRAGNEHLDAYDRLGYVPSEEGRVCLTQDYAFDDYCVAQLAAALGKEDEHRRFLARSHNWRNLFHPEWKYIVPRDAAGDWKVDFDPFSGEHFMEGNSWQYSWYVPHDVPGLVEAMGRDLFLTRLEEGFAKSVPHHFAAHAFDRTEATSAEYYVNHGNQVNMQAAYLFNYAGAPWLTQKYARAIMDAYYGATPYHGWEGDEDEGQMGAWFVMSALGLFEMDGGVTAHPAFDLGSPLFARTTVRLDPAYHSGGTFEVVARNNAKNHPYVHEARWNGEPLTEPRLPFSAVADGGRLELVMGPEPNRHFWRSRTSVAIDGERFLIDGRPTYEGRTWNGHAIEGLLFNARLVQGIFDDLNPDTRGRWKYPDTGEWDPDRNTDEFVAAMSSWKRHGLLAFTLNVQGGSPMGYGNQGWRNPGYHANGSLRADYMARLARILDRADELGMVVILGLFYFGQDQELTDEAAVVNAVTNVVSWLHDRGDHHVLIEVNNECNVRYDHAILGPERVHELIRLVRSLERGGHRYPAGTSYGGGTIPGANVVAASDFLLLHGNGVRDPERIAEMVRRTRELTAERPVPILFNEDDHYRFDEPRNNFTAAVASYASWGFFDYRRKEEPFGWGFQSVPVDWTPTSPRKRAFFALLERITGR